jgi:hypothetical protein
VPRLLRWSSLLGSGAILYALGAARVHHHNFPLFLAVVLALALVTVAVFVWTREAP